MNEPLDPPNDSACAICGEWETYCACKPCELCKRKGDRSCIELHGHQPDCVVIEIDD